MTDETRTPQDADEAAYRPGRAGTGDGDNPANAQDRMTERLDEALEETFPSSDPVSVTITK